MPSSSQLFGRLAENLAEQMLRKKGYRIIAKNLRLAGGELDIIAEDGHTLVFIEVKARRGDKFGGASYAISTHKKQQLIKLALCYLAKYEITDKQCRFDAILIASPQVESPQITHIKQAFEVPSSDWQW